MAEASEPASAGVAFPKVTRRTAWIYGSIGFPLAILGYPLGSYIPRLYSTEMGIGLAQIGMVIMAAAIFDALTDPLMGHFSDSLKTRWGRRKPWILLGIPFWLFAVWMLLNPAAGVTVVYLGFFFF
ncbi:MAG: MFS transporter, partial [Luteolibacter sp.]